MTSRLRIIVTGLIAEYPLGGMTWHYLQYVLGLVRLGHDVYYIEDSGGWPYHPREGALIRPLRTRFFNVDYLAAAMARYGLGERWAYRAQIPGESWWFGLPDERRNEVIGSADLLINVSGALQHPERYRSVRRLVYIDTDPVFTQLRPYLAKKIGAHDVHFSFGERVAEHMPHTGRQWHPTRQPIVLSEWRTGAAPRAVYTTVMNWTSYTSETCQGRTYGQKDIEFMRFLDLPRRLEPIRFEIAASSGYRAKIPRALVTSHGWHLVDPLEVCPDPASYRRFVQSSRGEWSVAKNGYVQARSAWFSERSACYLAAGRPVIVQDTGFSELLPVGEGIVPFSTAEEAVAAVREVEADYSRHAVAAGAIAEECFGSDVVLASLLERAGGSVTCAPASAPPQSSGRDP